MSRYKEENNPHPTDFGDTVSKMSRAIIVGLNDAWKQGYLKGESDTEREYAFTEDERVTLTRILAHYIQYYDEFLSHDNRTTMEIESIKKKVLRVSE